MKKWFNKNKDLIMKILALLIGITIMNNGIVQLVRLEEQLKLDQTQLNIKGENYDK